eukprot:tig00000754_g3904.t1
MPPKEKKPTVKKRRSEEADDDEEEEYTPDAAKKKQAKKRTGPSQAASQSRASQADSDDDEAGGQRMPAEDRKAMAADLVRLLLAKDVQKLPVKRDDIKNLVVKDYKDRRVVPEIIAEAKRMLAETFAFEILEVERASRGRKPKQESKAPTQQNKLLILRSLIPVDPRASVAGNEADGRHALLISIASLVYLSKGPDGSVKEGDLWDYLHGLGFTEGETFVPNGPSFRDIVDKDFTKQMYVDRYRDGEEQLYALGPRLRAELSDRDVLEAMLELADEANEEQLSALANQVGVKL